MRFYLGGVNSYFKLYCSPINFDPPGPSLSHILSKELLPGNSGKDWPLLHSRYALRYLALNEGRLTDEVFLEQVTKIQEEKGAIFNLEFERFQKGFLFCYFENPGIVHHMFRRYRDRESPLYQESVGKNYEDPIEECYRKMDSILGRIRETIDTKTLLIICSDRGFGLFRRADHINSWLRSNEFLYLKSDRVKGRELFQDVDWSRTKAYALSFGSIYINQEGREGKGIVSLGEETERLKKDIIGKISTWKDPKNNEFLVSKVYLRKEIFWRKYINESPDMVTGSKPGYRAS